MCKIKVIVLGEICIYILFSFALEWKWCVPAGRKRQNEICQHGLSGNMEGLWRILTWIICKIIKHNTSENQSEHWCISHTLICVESYFIVKCNWRYVQWCLMVRRLGQLHASSEVNTVSSTTGCRCSCYCCDLYCYKLCVDVFYYCCCYYVNDDKITSRRLVLLRVINLING